MKSLSIDLETFSDVDLNKSGVYRYTESPAFEILLFGFARDDDPVTVLDLTAGDTVPKDVLDALTDETVTKWAFNASFERICLSAYLRKYYPERFVTYSIPEDSVRNYLDPASWRCSMIWSAYLGLVKRIYRMFMEGTTPYGIATKLTEENIPSPSGKQKWHAGTVKAILSNEKYKGDALLQKSFTVDFLTKKTKINEGEVPQYYVEKDHEAIIDPEIFDQVQDELKRRCPGRNRYSGVHVFSGKVKCGQCGSWYGSKVWHSNDKYRRTIWQCNHKYDGGEKCKTPVLTDDELKGKYISAVNKLFADKKSILADYNEILAGPLYDTSGLERKRTEYEDEMSTAAELVQKEIKKNALEPQNQAEYQKRYDTLTERFNAAKKSLADTEAEISRKELARSSIRQFLATLGKQKDLVTTFDAVQFQSLVDFITVYSKDDIRINFKNGMEIKA